MTTKRTPCPLGNEGWRTTRWPGTRDQCPGCGRIVYTRADGTCRPHTKPTRLPPGDRADERVHYHDRLGDAGRSIPIESITTAATTYCPACGLRTGGWVEHRDGRDVFACSRCGEIYTLDRDGFIGEYEGDDDRAAEEPRPAAAIFDPASRQYVLPADYDPSEDADSELSIGFVDPGDRYITVRPTHGASPGTEEVA